MRICVIGGGASGLCAAIAAAEAGAEVTVIEHGPRVGKKLLSTGNGKCNLSNVDQELAHYHGDREFIKGIFEEVSYGEVIAFLTRQGIFTRNRNGYLYPFSEQASAVLDVFRFALRRLSVEVLVNEEIETVSVSENKEGGKVFTVHSTSGKLAFDRLILAAGSKAAPGTGSDGSGYKLAGAFGHNIRKPLPALVSLKSDTYFCKELKGLRFSSAASLYIDGELKAREEGELQFTDYGLSGIPVFQLSHIASEALDLKHPPEIRISVDLMPIMSVSELTGYLLVRREADPRKQAAEFLIGVLPKSLAILINRLCGVRNTAEVSSLSAKKLEQMAAQIKSLDFNITGTGGFEKAQTCTGGIVTSELTGRLCSRLVEGLYFSGEIIDVNGDCGGYNLTWAFATGILAGRAAAGFYCERQIRKRIPE